MVFAPSKSPLGTLKDYLVMGLTPTRTLVNSPGPDNVVMLTGSKVTKEP